MALMVNTGRAADDARDTPALGTSHSSPDAAAPKTNQQSKDTSTGDLCHPVIDAFAHRVLAHSTRPVMALVVHPTERVGEVLHALRGVLYVQRGVRHVHDVLVDLRTGVYCFSPLAAHSTGAGAAVPRQDSSGSSFTQCKLLLLDDAHIPPSPAAQHASPSSTFTDILPVRTSDTWMTHTSTLEISSTHANQMADRAKMTHTHAHSNAQEDVTSHAAVTSTREVDASMGCSSTPAGSCSTMTCEPLCFTRLSAHPCAGASQTEMDGHTLPAILSERLRRVQHRAAAAAAAVEAPGRGKDVTTPLWVALVPWTIVLSFANYTMPELLRMVWCHYATQQRQHVQSAVNEEGTSTHGRNSMHSANTNKDDIATATTWNSTVTCPNHVAIDSSRSSSTRDDEKTSSISVRKADAFVALSGFEQVGHIAHVNLSRAHAPYRAVIGQVILDCNPSVAVVVNKVESISSVFREFKMEVIAQREEASAVVRKIHCPDRATSAVLARHGSTRARDQPAEEAQKGKDKDESSRALDDLLTAVVRQHGCTFFVPYNRVYWNSRLSHEHTRLVDSMQPGDVLFDAMAGVGPFAIPAARRRMRALPSHTRQQRPLQKQSIRTSSQDSRRHAGCDGSTSNSDCISRADDNSHTHGNPNSLGGTSSGSGLAGVGWVEDEVTVFANDLNPVAAQYARINAELNSVPATRMAVYNMDARDFLNTVLYPYLMADPHDTPKSMHHGETRTRDGGSTEEKNRVHVVMNLPAIAVEFLDIFAPPLQWGGFCATHDETATTTASSTEERVGAPHSMLTPWQQWYTRAAAAASSRSLSSGSACCPVSQRARRCMFHVYCFVTSTSADTDGLTDAAVALVERHLGHSLRGCRCGAVRRSEACVCEAGRKRGREEMAGHDGRGCEAVCDVVLVRDVAPHKFMMCVSFVLPDSFWRGE